MAKTVVILGNTSEVVQDVVQSMTVDERVSRGEIGISVCNFEGLEEFFNLSSVTTNEIGGLVVVWSQEYLEGTRGQVLGSLIATLLREDITVALLVAEYPGEEERSEAHRLIDPLVSEGGGIVNLHGLLGLDHLGFADMCLGALGEMVIGRGKGVERGMPTLTRERQIG